MRLAVRSPMPGTDPITRIGSNAIEQILIPKGFLNEFKGFA
jgi:hypothetical protein